MILKWNNPKIELRNCYSYRFNLNNFKVYLEKVPKYSIEKIEKKIQAFTWKNLIEICISS